MSGRIRKVKKKRTDAMNRPNRKKTRQAFTLIELLVVIAIIALLLSIIIPSLKLAKEHARNLICKSNLKTFGIAGTAYLSDNDEKFTSSFVNLYAEGVVLSGSSCQWHNKDLSPWETPANAGPLWNYIENPDVLLCPTFVTVQKRWHYKLVPTCTIPMDPQFAFSQNAFLGRTDGRGVLRVTEVSSPSTTLFWAEETTWPIEKPIGSGIWIAKAVLNDTNFMARHPLDPHGATPGDGIATYHGIPNEESRRNDGQGDVLYIDGHVEFAKSEIYSESGGLRFTTSYVLAWPKANKFMTTGYPYQ